MTRRAWIAALLALTGGWVSGAPSQQPQPQPQPVAGTALLAGQVVEYPSGRPIAGATVAVVGRGSPMGRGGPSIPAATSDAQGRFSFANLRADTYVMRADAAGYGPTSPLVRPIELADAARIVDVIVRLVRAGSISGALRDDAGDPVVGTDVIAFRRTVVNGRAAMRQVSLAKSDDRGIYRLTTLQPGEYYVCACARDQVPFDGLLLTTLASEPLQLMGLAGRALRLGPDVAKLDGTLRTFAPTLYPNSTSLARATRVTVAPGDDKAAIDIDLTSVRATRVSGTINGAPNPVPSAAVRLIPAAEGDDASAPTSIMPVIVMPDGRFDFAGVPPGQYTLRVRHVVTGERGGGPSGSALQFLGARGSPPQRGGPAQPTDDPPLWAAEPITVGDNGVTGLSVALRPGANVSGRLQFVGSSAQPTPGAVGRGGGTPQALIIVQSVNPDPARPGETTVTRVTPEWTFQARGLVPGRYAFTSSNVAGWPTLKSVLVRGADLTDLPFDVDQADIDDVLITMTDVPAGMLTGTLPGAKPNDEFTALIFPVNRRYWPEPVAAQRRYRTAAIARTGVFMAPGLPGGEYFIAVVPDQASVDWQEPGRLEVLARTAQRVTLADGEKKTIELKR